MTHLKDPRRLPRYTDTPRSSAISQAEVVIVNVLLIIIRETPASNLSAGKNRSIHLVLIRLYHGSKTNEGTALSQRVHGYTVIGVQIMNLGIRPKSINDDDCSNAQIIVLVANHCPWRI
jgi:hypothetical protein